MQPYRALPLPYTLAEVQGKVLYLDLVGEGRQSLKIALQGGFAKEHEVRTGT